MDWLAQSLRQNVEIALFLSIALGYGVGSLRLGGFQLGPVLGTLLAGLLVGQVGIAVPAAMQSAFFLLFLFAIGFRTGPDFFHGLRSSALPQIGLTVFLCVVALGLTWMFAVALALDGGTAAGLLAGALTNSTALGTATRAASALGGESAEHLANNVATAYALTYFLGTLLVVWFLPAIGPRLMRVNLADVCKELERTMGIDVIPAAGSAGLAVMVRAYRLPQSLAGRTVRAVEDLCSSNRVTIERLRRGPALMEVTATTSLETDDVIAIGGRRPAVIESAALLGAEVDDPELLDVPRLSADLVLTNRKFSRSALGALSEEVAARGVYLLRLRRGGRELPFTRATVVERGDVLTVTGAAANIARVADDIGVAEYPTPATDLTLVAGIIAVGGLIGLPTATFGRLELGLSAPVGVLLGGLTLGYLRSVNPRLGRVPEASLWLLESLGLAAFLALAGLGAGPALIDALRTAGPTLVAVGVVIAVLPHVATILVGHYALRLHPGILLGVCAGAGTSAPALSQLEKAAGSRIPTLGYGVACAVGNVLLAFWGTLLVVVGAR
jgi:putative transport protein